MEYNCTKCGKDRERSLRLINPESDILIVCNAPEKEEVYGKLKDVLRGPFAESIKVELEKNKIKTKNCSVLYAMACYPNGKISDTYIKCCQKKLYRNIQKINPKLIISFGEYSINSLLGIKNKETITKLRNRIIPSFDFNCLIYSTFHPRDFIKREYGQLKTDWSKKYAFEKDIKRISELYHLKYRKRKIVDKTLEKRNLSNYKIIIIKNNNELNNALNELRQNGKMAFDVETNTLKVYLPKFDIRVFGFGTDRKAFVIDRQIFTDNQETMNKIILDSLQDPELLKIIQNKKYEESCSRVWFKKYNWKPTESGNLIHNSFDTMIVAHVIDERRGCTSLDFQNLVRFGMLPYNGKVKKFIESKTKDTPYNEIKFCPSKDLIEYNALDIITSYANYLISDSLLKTEKQRWCYNFLHEGHEVFNNMYEKGLPTNKKILDNLDEDLKEKQKNIQKEIFNLDDVKQFIEEKNHG